MCQVGVSIGSTISTPIQRLRGVVETLEEKGREIVDERKLTEDGREKVVDGLAEYDKEKDILSVLSKCHSEELSSFFKDKSYGGQSGRMRTPLPKSACQTMRLLVK